MGEQDDARASGPRRIRDQPVAGRAGGGGQTGRGLVSAPVESAPVGAGGPGRRFREGGPACAVGIETVVDGQGQQAAAVRPRPVGGETQQGEGVPAAGQGQGERMIDVGLEPRGQGGPGGPGPVGGIVRQPGLRAGAAGQPIRVRVSAARVRTAALAASA